MMQDTWWHLAADAARARGWYRIIPSRQDPGRTLLERYWLTPPRVPENPADVWESAESVMLHRLVGHDEDAALHDHPWCFYTTILSGAYAEAVPPENWNPHGELGPPDWDLNWHFRGDTVSHAASDLHRIELVAVDTWTLVRTGPRAQRWGFWPAGEAWVGHETYLGRNRP